MAVATVAFASSRTVASTGHRRCLSTVLAMTEAA